MNLTIAFERKSYSTLPILCYIRHPLDLQDYKVFARIKADAIQLPQGVRWHRDDGIKQLHQNVHGEPLTWISADTLAGHLSGATLAEWDAATLAFLKAIPPGTKVVLWWH